MVAPYAPPQQPPMQQGYGAPPQADPYAGAIEADYTLPPDLVEAAARKIGPPRPPWLKETKNISIERIKQEAETQRTAHQLRLVAGILMELRVGVETNTVFEGDQSWVHAGAMEAYKFPLISRATADLSAFIESMNVQLSSPARGIINRDEASIKDDALHELLCDWEESHFRSGQGPLSRTLTYDALNHGMVAVYIAPDPGNKRTGVRIRAVDPKTVFPMFSSRGLERVYCMYEAGPDEMEGNFGDNGPASNAIDSVSTKSGNGDVEYNERGPAIELWTRERGVVIWKDKVIRRWEHHFWECPWIIGIPAWRYGRNLTVNAGNLPALGDMGTGVPGGMLDQFGREVQGTSVQRDLARKFEPFFTSALSLNDTLEMIGTRYQTGVKDARDPELYWRRSQMMSGEGAPRVTRWPGHVVEDEQGSELDIVPTAPIADHADPLWTILTTHLQIVLPLPFLQGIAAGANSSGQAVDILNETGYAKWTAPPIFYQHLYSQIGHRYLTIHKEWSDTMPGGDQGRGTGFQVQSRTPGRYGVYAAASLTKELLERTGCYTKCKLSRFSLQGMTAALASAQMLFQSMGIMDDVEVLELLGASENPLRTSENRRWYDLVHSPEFIKAMTIPWVRREILEAIATKDFETAWEMTTAIQRLATQQTMQDSMMGMAPAGGGMLGGNQDPMAVLQGLDPAMVQQWLQQQSGAGGALPIGANATNLQSPGDLLNDVGHAGGRTNSAATALPAGTP